jgi:hypothetical protein
VPAAQLAHAVAADAPVVARKVPASHASHAAAPEAAA